MNLLLKDKICNIVISLKSEGVWHLSRIAEMSKTTFVYVSKTIPKLEKEGIVKSEMRGKKKIVALTDKGIRLAGLIEEIRNIMAIKQEVK